MAAKGFTKAADNPDVVVVYHVAFDKQKDISTFSSGYGGGYGPYGYGYGGGWGGGTTTTQVRDILVGTLVIDIADAGHKQVVWRGMGVKEIDTQAKPDKRDKSINEGGRTRSSRTTRRRRRTRHAAPPGDLRARGVRGASGRVGAVRRASAAQSASAAQTKTLNLSAYAELLRAISAREKVAILTEVMDFTEAEDKAFWPIYREYDAEMAKLGDERVALVADYARGFDQLTDDAADKLARRALDLEARRQAVKAKYYERVAAALKRADGAPVPAGRAPAAAAHRSADFRGAADRRK